MKQENPKMVIYFSQQDLEDLASGKEFKWTFPTDKGQDIDVLLQCDGTESPEVDEEEVEEELSEEEGF